MDCSLLLSLSFLKIFFFFFFFFFTFNLLLSNFLLLLLGFIVVVFFFYLFFFSFQYFLFPYWAVFPAGAFGFLALALPVGVCSLECNNNNNNNNISTVGCQLAIVNTIA